MLAPPAIKSDARLSGLLLKRGRRKKYTAMKEKAPLLRTGKMETFYLDFSFSKSRNKPYMGSGRAGWL